jgi:hypothetical protein
MTEELGPVTSLPESHPPILTFNIMIKAQGVMAEELGPVTSIPESHSPVLTSCLKYKIS